MLFSIVEEKPYNTLNGKGVPRFSLGIAMDLWTEPIFFQASGKVLEPFLPDAVQKSEHPGTYWLSLVNETSVRFLTLTLLMSC